MNYDLRWSIFFVVHSFYNSWNSNSDFFFNIQILILILLLFRQREREKDRGRDEKAVSILTVLCMFVLDYAIQLLNSVILSIISQQNIIKKTIQIPKILFFRVHFSKNWGRNCENTFKYMNYMR